VSVAGGRRVEIKGVGNHRRLPLLTHNEAFRQLNLLRIRAELLRRGVDAAALAVPEGPRPWDTSRHVTDATPLLRRCDYMPVREALDRGDMKVAALALRGFGGLLGRRTQPGVAFAREFADRVRVIACLTAHPFMIHSDVTDYGLSPTEWKGLRKSLRADTGDGIIVLWGPEEDIATAVREVFARAREALVGVPAETRQPFADGTSGFERILPGADRMYPDTDTPPRPIPDELVAEVRAQLPERPWEREKRYEGLGFTSALAARLASVPPVADLFDALVVPAGPVARRVALALLKRPPRWRSRRAGQQGATPERLGPLVRAFASGPLRPEGFEWALERALTDPARPVTELIEAVTPRPGDDEEVERRVRAAVENCRPLGFRSPASVLRFAMGLVMPGLLGRVDPVVVRQRLERELSAVLEVAT
jgi:glutamyl-tRNA(Gln) amidotransferase subunit E